VITRSGDLTYNSNHNLSTTDTTKISKVQTIPKIRNNFKLSNQTLTINPPILKSSRCQDKPKHKILLIGDSHTKGCTSKLQEKLKNHYDMIGYVKPDAGATVLTKAA
jgi:hypothetical protein